MRESSKSKEEETHVDAFGLSTFLGEHNGYLFPIVDVMGNDHCRVILLE